VAVAVVDDDEWRRRGLVDGIRELGGRFAVAGAGPRDEAPHLGLVRAGVVIVAADSGVHGWDRLVGLRTAGDLRSRLGDGPRIVVLADDLANPLVPVRAVEAGADHLYPRTEVHDLDSLHGLVRSPSPERHPAALIDAPRLRELGVSPSSRLSAGLALIEQRGVTGLFDDPPTVQLTRRQSITLRRAVATTMAVHPAGPVTAARNQAVRPTWHQLRRVVDLARGAALPFP
jgi:DNA-binding NarL/FixJ family response regulator